MSITTTVQLHNEARHIVLQLHLNKTVTITVEGENVTPRQILDEASRQLGDDAVAGAENFIAVSESGTRRIENVDTPLESSEEMLIVDRKRSNG